MNRLDIPDTQLNEGCIPGVVLILSIGTVQGPGDEQLFVCMPFSPFVMTP
jgi:hypothetical protein